jgi:hypothetical protein
VNTDGTDPGRQEERAGQAADGSTIGVERSAVRAQLLERLQKQIDLPAWVIAHGFHLAPVQRDLTNLAFANRHGETLHLRRDVEKGTWTYQTDREPIERGTVVDLMVRRDAIGLDECINRLAACVDPSRRTREPLAYREALADPNQILRRAVAEHVAAVTAERDAERDLERLGVLRGTFDSWRFGSAATVLDDPETLAHSRYRPGDRQMVFVERPIDAIAYEQVHGQQRATYVYVGDNPSDQTKRKIAHIIADAPRELVVVAAFAKDRKGVALSEEITELAGPRPVARRKPELGSRWADQMQIQQRHRDVLDRVQRRRDPALGHTRRASGKSLDPAMDQAAIRTAIVKRTRRAREGLDR